MQSDTSVLMRQFAHICRLLHMSHHMQHRKHGPMADPHRGQGRVLAALKMQPEISQKNLSYLLDIRPQSLGELLSKLEKGGFVTRTPSETDNRVMDISLTEAGAAAAESREEDADDLFSELTDEERGVLAGYLERVIAGLEKKLGGEDEIRRRFHAHGRGRGHDFRPDREDDGHAGQECCGRGRGHRGHPHGHDHPRGHGHSHDHDCRCRFGGERDDADESDHD